MNNELIYFSDINNPKLIFENLFDASIDKYGNIAYIIYVD